MQDVSFLSAACDVLLTEHSRIVVAMPDASEGGLQRPYRFRTFSIPDSQTDKHYEHDAKLNINEVCRATSAAPKFFKGVRIRDVKYRTGDLWCADPALEICELVKKSNFSTHDPVAVFVSIRAPHKKSPRFQTATKISSLTSVDEAIIEYTLRTELKKGDYIPFEGPSDLLDLDVNEWRSDSDGKHTFHRVEKSTKEYCENPEIKKRIDECAEKLVKIRQQRAKTIRWEQFSLGIKYNCPDHASKIFRNRDLFLDHMMFDHDWPPPDEQSWREIQKLMEEYQIKTIS